jgi:predicted DCC family thiol-disulfide oxidoreductase YuxK
MDERATSDIGKIILFDGVCDLCNGFVQFVIDRDPHGRFKFGALQSPEAEDLLKDVDLDPADLDTVVYIRGDRIYTRSGAALRILGDLGGIWSFFALKLVIPPPVRDLVYRLIAKRRYSLFGKKDQCMVPTPELKARFIHGR